MAPHTDTRTRLRTRHKAEYDSEKARLKVEATSSAGGSVTLTAIAYDSSGNVLGSTQLGYDAKKDKHMGKITGLTSEPFSVEVTSTGVGFGFVEGCRDNRPLQHRRVHRLPDLPVIARFPMLDPGPQFSMRKACPGGSIAI